VTLTAIVLMAAMAGDLAQVIGKSDGELRRAASSYLLLASSDEPGRVVKIMLTTKCRSDMAHFSAADGLCPWFEFYQVVPAKSDLVGNDIPSGSITQGKDPDDTWVRFTDAPLREDVNTSELLDCLKWMRARVTCRNCGPNLSVTDVQPMYYPPAEVLRRAAKEIEAHDAKLKECDGVIGRLEKVTK